MVFPRAISYKFIIQSLILLRNSLLATCQIPSLRPGDTAPPFAIQTLAGRILYKSQKVNSSISAHPVIFHAYSKYSAFLEALWTDKRSLTSLVEHTPRNTHFVFLSSSDWAQTDALRMRRQLHGAIDQYFNRANKRTHLYCRQDGLPLYISISSRSGNDSYQYLPASNNSSSSENYVKRDSISDIRNKRMLGVFDILDKKKSKKKHQNKKGTKEKEPFYFISRKEKSHHHQASCLKKEAEHLKRRLHFVSLPIHEQGNWIPYVLGHWPCFGVGCALSQVAFKTKSGEIMVVTKRLDARYDWLPSPFQMTHLHTSIEVVDYGTACHTKHKLHKQTFASYQRWKRNKLHKRKHGKVALISSDGSCTLFEKIKNMAKTDVDTVLIYTKPNEHLKELQCHKHHCFHPMTIAASMIPYNQGIYIHNMLSRGRRVFVQYQTTPQDNYFFAIDGQGKLAEVGMFLYPSMKFLAYEAKWFNYKTDLIHNVTGSAKVIHVFDHALMKGQKGVSTTISLPPLQDLLMYRNVELDMALHCPGKSDYSCPHWDHVIHLTVCCEKGNSLCGEELGRWISPYRRSIGRWLTNITPLLPMFTSRTCKLRMIHPSWEMPWKPSLNIRFSDHIKYSKHHYSGKRADANVVPYRLMKLFQGGKFDKKYNRKYSPIHFKSPDWTKRVKLIATITGHGSDNHGCAEFCVTSHHFIFNGHANVRVFKNAATATGCAQRVAEGVEPNEHGTWLYGRDGWCPGQDVVPWVVDVTDQVKLDGGENRVNYFGLFKGKDPNPERKPGEILMNSYLVFYKSAKDIVNRN